ncbi:MAG TPA: alpha/beta hydrolase [Candidatus Cybelea sp.]|nr:alpha/beta hydrolase [Candidatus Cybelea sp.]
MNGAGFLVAAGRRLEYAWLGPSPAQSPTIVFLHEGLGSLGLWREFPGLLAERTGCGALIYSRAGYGNSDPVPLPRPITYMHDEALVVLPEVLARSGVRRFILFGHSDGASIALIYAGGTPAGDLLGLVLEAPHVFTEDISVRSIAAAAEAYRTTDLREKLRRWHGENTDVAFQGWNQAWLDPAFRAWNIEEYLAPIRVRSLVIQGEGDEYGTVAQVEAIQRQSGGSVAARVLPDCGHSPHRDRPAEVLDASSAFIAELLR